MSSELSQKLSQERRARLAAERLLQVKQAELFRANEKLAAHARLLSEEIVEKRQEVLEAKSAAEELKSENTEVRQHLAKAEEATVVAERRLWDALETINDGFAIYDESLTLVLANRAYLSPFEEYEIGPGTPYGQILEIAAEEGLINLDGVDSKSWCRMMLQRWLKPNIEPMKIELFNKSYVKLHDRWTHEGDLVSLAIDITGSVRYEERLDKARIKAEAASRTKSAFLANMSHEIRTPMNGVVGMADLLYDTPLNEEQRLYVETIKNSGEALLEIINQILDYSKIEAEKLKLYPEPFDLERCCQDIVTLLRTVATDKGLELTVDYDIFLPTRFVGDPGRIRQILTNLIGNAVKFTTEGHVIVRVVGLETNGGKHSIHVNVEDTGIGISKEGISKIFGEFNQVEDAQNRKFEGTGLGLSITQQLVHLMGGKIWVDSELGVGSSFGFQIGLDLATDLPSQALPEVGPLTEVVLIDTPSQGREVFARQLVALGIKTAVGFTVDEAREALEGAPDGILADALSDPDGAEAMVAKLTEAFPGVPIVVLRSHGGATEGLTQVVGVVNKPVNRQDCFSSLNLLAAAAAERQADTLAEEVADVLQEAETPPVAAPHQTEEARIEDPVVIDEEPRQMRVLAAEDNKTNRLVFLKMVKALDIELKFVENGLEAVECVPEFLPDLIFTDISMPEMDGKEAATRIRQWEAEAGVAHTPIIAMTAHAMEGDDEGILASGIDEYLTKPLKKALILKAIDAHKPGDARPPQPDAEPTAETPDAAPPPEAEPAVASFRSTRG